MKTGLYEQVRHQTSVIAALFFAFALVFVLSGCEDNSPVSAPTSTMPGSDSEPSPPNESNSHQIPEYETDLELNDEEKEAVEGALVAFEGYIATINRVFSSGGKDMSNTGEFARDSSLKSLQKSANDLNENGQYMAGEYDFYDLKVHQIDYKPENSYESTVEILYCSHDSKHAVVDMGDALPDQPEQSLTIKHTVTNREQHWKIANQELWSKTCE